MTQDDVLELLRMYSYGSPKERVWAKKLLKEWLEERKAEKSKKINT